MSRLRPLLALLTATAASALGQTGPGPGKPEPSPARPAPAPATPAPVGTAAPERFLELLLPFRTDSASLSPDGKLLAYSLREGEALAVLIVEADNPAKVRSKVIVGTDDTSTPSMQTETTEKTPARIRRMLWATPTRLIVETNANLATQVGDNWINTSGALFAVDADGQKGRTLVTPRDIADITPKPDLPPESENPDAILPPDQVRAPSTSAGNAYVNDPNDISFVTGGTNNLPADNRNPRSPTFFDFIPGEPDWISIRSSDSNKYSLYKVQIHTGSLKYGKNHLLVGDFTPLIDRQGNQGAAIVNNLKNAFPHEYLLEKKSGLGRWTPLSKVVKIPATDFTLSPKNYLSERSFPIGFDENPDILYYASNVGRDTYGVYAVDLKTGERTGKPIESPQLDLVSAAPDGFFTADNNPLVFDRFSRQLLGLRYSNATRSALWFRPEWQEVQAKLESVYPGRSVDILEWDQSANRFLARVQSPTDAGAYCVFDRSTQKVMEFVRRAPWIKQETNALVMSFSIPNPQGGKLGGILAIPREVRQKPIPIVVMCPDEPWMRAPTDFHNEINAIAGMGFAVLQINARGTWGFGVKHRLAAQEAFDEIQVQDFVTVIDELSKSIPLNPKRVAILGAERGGYLAFRALQLRPDRFRCAVGLNPTVDIASWLSDNRWNTGAAGPALTRSFYGEKLLKNNSLVKSPDTVTKPVFILSYRGLDGAPTNQTYLDAQSLGRSLERREVPVKYYELSTDYMRGLPHANSDALRNIEDFLNENIYAYNVQMGETEVLENVPPQTAPKK